MSTATLARYTPSVQDERAETEPVGAKEFPASPLPRKEDLLLSEIDLAFGSGLSDQATADYLASKDTVRKDGHRFTAGDVAELARRFSIERADPVRVANAIRGGPGNCPRFIDGLRSWA